MTPPCHNRPPFAPGRMEHGISRETGQPIAVFLSNDWFTHRCATHDGVVVGRNNENFPNAHGWNCSGCRWLPEEYKNA